MPIAPVPGDIVRSPWTYDPCVVLYIDDDTMVLARQGKRPQIERHVTKHMPQVIDRGAGIPTSVRATFSGRSEGAAQEKEVPVARELAAVGYVEAHRHWKPGAWTGGQFLVAVVLCFLLVGIFAFLYMLIVKPDGELAVEYALGTGATAATQTAPDVTPSAAPTAASSAAPTDVKVCPFCAETIKAAAILCRYCGQDQLLAQATPDA